jgi:hypothetical protein
MKSNIRQAAINAIKDGNLSQLRALKVMIGSSGLIPIYYQVLGNPELYNQSGAKVEVKESDLELGAIDGVLPLVSSVVVTFPSMAEMKKVFQEGKENESVLTR